MFIQLVVAPGLGYGVNIRLGGKSMMGGYYLGGWMIIVWVIILGLIVWGVIALTRYAAHNSGSVERRSALDIAKERYARGEITKDEYERIKKDLT